MSLYGIFERLPLAGVLASLSIIFSAAYTIFMYNRIAFAGSYYIRHWDNYIPDLNKREFSILLILIFFTVLFGLYPAPLLEGLHCNASNLIYSYNQTYLSADLCKHITEITINNFFDEFKYNIGQVTYTDVNYSLFNLLKDSLEN